MKRYIILQHNNAHSQTAHLTLGKIEKFGWEVLPDSPNNLNLALSDYHLFGPLKDHMGRQHYENNKAVQKTMQTWLQDTETVSHSGSRSNGRNAHIVLWILWNSDRTFPITQDGVCFCTHTFAII
jgi:hypothetical protein